MNIVLEVVRLCAFSALLLLPAASMAYASPGSGMRHSEQGATTTSDAVAHAYRVERRALQTSFVELEAFGRDAILRNDAEGLSRLQHVAWIMINQNDFSKAERWNAALHGAAARQRSARYQAVAQVNDLWIAYARDGDDALPRMEALAAAQTDWLAKAVAQTAVARVLIDEQRIGEAIHLMAHVMPLIPEDQATVASVAASAWDRVSIAHMMVDDLPGYLKAIDRAEAYMAASDYPRPDYDSVYNLAQSLGFLGRYDEAETLVGIYARLAERTDTPTSRAHAGNLCAYAATTRDAWPEVLRCLAPLDASLDLPTADVLLPLRAAAYARTGQVAPARRDMAEIGRRIADGRMTVGGAVSRAAAELKIAEGNYAEGVPALRKYHLDRFLRASKSAAAAMEQVVVGIDDQLQVANEQNTLKAKVIDTQRWLVGVSIALALVAAFMFWRQRQTSAQLAAASRRLQESYDAKSAFFANMSHEIRTPLNGVVAMADALERTTLDDHARHMVRIIASSGATLERLLSDILDSAKMEAGQIQIEVLPFDLHETVTATESLWTQAGRKKGVEVEAHIGPDVERWAMGDRVRLSQVLNNLVSNALKFTPQGKVVLTAEAVQAGRVKFTVSDTGVGFDAAQKAKLFKRFQQADGTIARRFGGTGLGLSICRQLVELMGGELDCDSTPGVGSRFWFEIDLPTAPAEVAIQGPATSDDDVTTGDEPPLKLLVVDDHPANRTILGVLLEDEATELHYAENGQQALDAVRSESFDVILMDMQMPVMGGLDATRAIRALEAERGTQPTTIIIFSANSGIEEQNLGREAGADGHIAKPVVLERLLEGINLALKRNRGATAEPSSSDGPAS